MDTVQRSADQGEQVNEVKKEQIDQDQLEKQEKSNEDTKPPVLSPKVRRCFRVVLGIVLFPFVILLSVLGFVVWILLLPGNVLLLFVVVVVSPLSRQGAVFCDTSKHICGVLPETTICSIQDFIRCFLVYVLLLLQKY